MWWPMTGKMPPPSHSSCTFWCRWDGCGWWFWGFGGNNGDGSPSSVRDERGEGGDGDGGDGDGGDGDGDDGGSVDNLIFPPFQQFTLYLKFS